MMPEGTSPSRAFRWPRYVIWLATGITILLAVVFQFDADNSRLGMLLAFAPRSWILIPWALLLTAALLLGVPTLLTAIVGASVAAIFVSGFELPRWRTPDVSGRALRIVTYNTDRSALLATTLRRDLAEWGADVVLLQDCKTIVADSLRVRAPVSLHITPEFCFASRYPLRRVDTLHTAVRTGTGTVGRFGNVLRYEVELPTGALLPIYSLHLESPRNALWAARNLDFSQLTTSMMVRGADSRRATQFVSRADSAFVVAGDFNLPYGSLILKRDWGDLTNAFAEVGWGFGNTMRAGRFQVRIDHVLTPPTLVPMAVKVLSGYPSEHQPVVVDLAWRGDL